MSTGTIINLQICATRGQPMQSKTSVRAIADLGLEGDAHARQGSARQVLLMDEETLGAFGLQAGVVRENITTRGIVLHSLALGTRLRVGDALFEITKFCVPCEFVEDLRPGLRAAMENQRGMLARVVEGGAIHVGDAVVRAD
ncbi:MAG: MOSC domain-containing protein [Chloroflexi bacterium]|nr:MOSC domain-containing protein [Chloroflexota bacterium]